MEVIKTAQYNQGVSKQKLLSTTAGVGSVITTKLGYYILVSDINKWPFVAKAQQELGYILEDRDIDNKHQAQEARKRLDKQGIELIDDQRFIKFIKKEKELSALLCLLDIPQLSINEAFNTINTKDNPKIKRLRSEGKKVAGEDFSVPGTHFPKWFKNKDGELKTYQEWLQLWRNRGLGDRYFAPPRDAKNPVKYNGNVKTVRDKEDNETRERPVYQQLAQTNLALICKEGHLSDIPWHKFLVWKTEKVRGQRNSNDRGEDLFEIEDKCSEHDLIWSENTAKAEGYGSIYLECRSCGLGIEENGNPKINLEGINNLYPTCSGHKSWEIGFKEDSSIPKDSSCRDAFGKKQTMQVALVTGNNMYFANGFSSLFIPEYMAKGVSPELESAISYYEDRYSEYLRIEPNTTRESFAEQFLTYEKVANTGFERLLETEPNAVDSIKKAIINGSNSSGNEAEDFHEQYRWEEYRSFTFHTKNPEGAKNLSFNDIHIPENLGPYLNKIQQIEELKITQVQLDFTRLKPKERIRRGDHIEATAEGQTVFSVDQDKVYALPATETFGEGLFFDFDQEKLDEWIRNNNTDLSERFNNLFKEFNENSQGYAIKQRINENGFKHILIHTFSHLVMRELEFLCGYPTSSLSERLYISQETNMNGVLIYTAEGSEGSMGGLVWQGEPENINEVVISALQRATDCSSDPLCWESEGQGVFNLNLSACFSCCLVSETACEEMNLGLDRRMLVDSEFGYFRDIIKGFTP
jgi:hypothetical protein